MRALCSVLVAATLVAGCEESSPAPNDAGVSRDGSAAFPDGEADAFVAPSGDAGSRDGGPPPPPPGCEPDAIPPPERVLFIGNSFTFTENMPRIFGELVAGSGYPEPYVSSRALGGQTLAFHRADTDPAGAPARVMEGSWDVVVLQEFSTRPTDSVGPAEQFEIDATWFYDLVKSTSPDPRVLLYETFARRSTHGIYPGTFDDPADMQAQLRFWYDDCAYRYIPTFSMAAVSTDVSVARVGDAWEAQLAGGEPPRLHGADDYHPSAAGAYLTAAVFFASVYGRRSDGLPAIGVDEDTARTLQATADAITGAERRAPLFECPLELPIGSRIAIDFGSIDAAGWHGHAALSGTSGPLTSVEGEPTSIRVTTSGFAGVQTGGRADNTLGLPPEVSRDTLWLGSFDGHAAALPMLGRVVLRNVPEGEYELVIFASREGDDGGAGRLTRYALGDEDVDVEVGDNVSSTALFPSVRPGADGSIDVAVRVSPDGSSRFAYVGALVLTRLGP